MNDSIPFSIADESTRLSERNAEAYAQLRSIWKELSSDARFAWQWSSLDRNQKYLELTGLQRKSEVRARIEAEMERVMKLILINYELWGPDEAWSLYFALGNRSVIGHEDGRLEKNDQHLYQWNQLLLNYLMPQFRHDWLRRHACVWDCWSADAPSVNVETESYPTAHEQFEAKLALHDWLADKVTPDVAARLLAGLDN